MQDNCSKPKDLRPLATKEALLYCTISLQRLWPWLLAHVVHNSYKVLFKQGPHRQHFFKLTCHPQANRESWICRTFSKFCHDLCFIFSKLWKLVKRPGSWGEITDPRESFFQLALLSILLPLRSRGTTENYSVELIIKTHGFIRHTELRTWREAEITAKTFMKE